MEIPPPGSASFDRLGPATPRVPLVVSVPHAGRYYPRSLLSRSALPRDRLATLEDRHADALVAGLPAMGITTFVARRARAWIDLNRDEREIDPAMVTPAPRAETILHSVKVRGGLGLIPRRVAGAGEIMWRRLTAEEVEERIVRDHRPWHAAIADALAIARDRFGVAVLLDIHSMPPLGATGTAPPARLVIGDRHGHSAAPHLVARLMEAGAATGLPVAHNIPYAGSYTLDRHGRPACDMHALQLEIDRSLYLTPDLREPGDGMDATVTLVEKMARALLDDLGNHTSAALAAE